ncbi:MAG: hypothetical protein ACI9U5_001731, partial [Colwellia sp.]
LCTSELNLPGLIINTMEVYIPAQTLLINENHLFY